MSNKLFLKKCPRQTVNGVLLAEELNAYMSCLGQADVYACTDDLHSVPGNYTDILYQGPNKNFTPAEQDALIDQARQMYLSDKTTKTAFYNNQFTPASNLQVVNSTNYRLDFRRVNSGTPANPQLLLMFHAEYYLYIGVLQKTFA